MSHQHQVTRDDLLRAIFGNAAANSAQFEPFMMYYNIQRQAARWKGAPVVDDYAVLRTLPQTPLYTRQQLLDTGIGRKALDLAARAMTMHDTNRWIAEEEDDSENTWQTGDTLKECISQYYSQSTNLDYVKLERSFNTRALEYVASFKIIWTEDLRSHLHIGDWDEDTQYVCIFHHATFLKHANKELFPPGFLDETLRTLALLFPFKDAATIRWFRQHTRSREKNALDPNLIKCTPLEDRQRQIDDFHYWRDRLIVLKKAYNASEPRTVSQWWYDRRRKVQWATFWVAALVLLLTVLFGTAQTLEGALQVYKAYYPTAA